MSESERDDTELNAELWLVIGRVPELSLNEIQRQVLKDGLVADPEAVNQLVERSIKMHSPSGYFVSALERIATEGWSKAAEDGGPSRTQKKRKQMLQLAINLRGAIAWTGRFASEGSFDENGRWVATTEPRWFDEEAEWARYVTLECVDAGIEGAAASIIRSARAAAPKLSTVPAAGNANHTRYAEPARNPSPR